MVRRLALSSYFPRLVAAVLLLSAATFADVTVNAPADGASTGSPLHVVASANPNNGAAIIAGQIYIDGRLSFGVAGASIDTNVNVGAGRHQVAVKFWDARGGTQMVTRTVTATGDSAGISLSSPQAGTVVNNTVQVAGTASAPSGIAAVQVYDNGNLVQKFSNGNFSGTLQLANGGHYLMVQAWDNNGKIYFSPVNITVAAGAASSPSNVQTGGPQANIPSGAASKLDIDQMGGWEHCDACAGINGAGPVDPYSMSQNISSPALDGKSATFWLGGDVPWGAALWWKQLGAIDSASHFVYDLYFFVQNPQIAQALEFDVNQSVNGIKYIFGTECGTRGNSGWRVWDGIGKHWMATGASCSVKANEWNHLTWEFERVGNQAHFIAVTLNGYRQVVDKYYPMGGSGVRELNVAFQMDGNEHQDDYQVWLDKVSLYAW